MSRRQFERVIIEKRSILPAKEVAVPKTRFQDIQETIQVIESTPKMSDGHNIIFNNLTTLPDFEHPSLPNVTSDEPLFNFNTSCMCSSSSLNSKNNISLEDKLRLLISKYHVSHNFVNELLIILRCEGLKLPKDVRTLLKSP